MGRSKKRCQRISRKGRTGQKTRRAAVCFFDQDRPRHLDPEEEDTFLELEDPEEEDTFLELEDPEEEDTFLELEDPEEEDTFLELEDPEEEDTFLELEDPSGSRRARRRLKNAALCGDYPTGHPGNIRRGAKHALTGKIVVRLASQFALAPDKSLEELATRLELAGLLSIIEKYELNEKSQRLVARRGSQEAYDQAQDFSGARDPDVTPDFARIAPEPTEVQPKEIVALETTVATQPLAPLHSLATYWRLDANHKSGKLRKILKKLNRLAEVNLAYPEVAATDASNGMGDPFVGVQTYLDRAPFGIDARWARRWGGDGRGVALVDMEQGWLLKHPELELATTAAPPMLIHGNNRDGHDGYKGNHGTAVLGEIIAASNSAGVVGIAPGVSKVGLASHFHSEPEPGAAAAASTVVPKTDSHVAEAIYAAISAPEGEEPFLKSGDVLLIEAQRAYLPTEIDPADFDAIRLASALGIIVVEAAGNGGRNLDRYRDARGAIFNRRRGGQESGAIMVGAALGALPHNRKRASNYGSRIDCYAWGNRVVTAGYGDLQTGGGPDATYTADFTNTSAAAPIIAGAALILQGMYQRATEGRRLAPGQMRALLADPATGTRQGRGVRGHIGVMPNLRAIIEHTLRIVPDVYMRDNLGDTGAVPATGRVCACPDVLVSRTARRDPVRAFGQGSGTENDPAFAFKAVPGRENFIYVRMKNRGLGQAEKIGATVYWTEAATLSTPDRWHEIGASEPILVPQGDTLAVSGPISWRTVPQSAYCLVTLIEAAGEPTRLPPGLLAAEGGRARHNRLGQESEAPAFDWYAFLAFLRDHNHLAIRNLHVIDDIPAAGTDKALDFLVTGTPAGDRGRFFDLEVLQHLPQGAELFLDVPMTLAPALSGSSWRSEINGRFLRFHLPNLPRVPFCRVPLSAGAEHGCRFIVRGADGMASGGHGFAIRQLYRSQEVGRVSWQFHRTRGRLRRRLRSRR